MTHPDRIAELERLQVIAENLKKVSDMQTNAYNIMQLPNENQKLMYSDNDRKIAYEYRKEVHSRWCKIYATALIKYVEAEGILTSLTELGIIQCYSQLNR
jgi:hypothetical protein